MSLKDPIRSFWISTLDSLRIFGVSPSRRILYFFSTLIFYFFSILFLGIFKQGSLFLFFFFIGFFFLIHFFFFFPPLAGKRGTMGPGFI